MFTIVAITWAGVIETTVAVCGAVTAVAVLVREHRTHHFALDQARWQAEQARQQAEKARAEAQGRDGSSG